MWSSYCRSVGPRGSSHTLTAADHTATGLDLVTHGTHLQQCIELGATYRTVVSLVAQIVRTAVAQAEVSARQYEGVAWLAHTDDTLRAVVVDIVITLQTYTTIIRIFVGCNNWYIVEPESKALKAEWVSEQFLNGTSAHIRLRSALP